MKSVGLISLFFVVFIQKINSALVTTTVAATTTTSQKNESEAIIVDGVNLSLLTDDELLLFLEAEDEKLAGYLDIWSGRQQILERLQKNDRKKRALPLLAARLAFTAGRALFRAVSGRIVSKSAGKRTIQYARKGNFRKAVSDFHRLKPTNVRPFKGKNGLVGLQGNVGKYTVKVRNKSSGNRPTLDLYRTDKGSRKTLRKVRYNRN